MPGEKVEAAGAEPVEPRKLSRHDKTLELWIEMAWPSKGMTTSCTGIVEVRRCSVQIRCNG
jgi:hypothetical protein